LVKLSDIKEKVSFFFVEPVYEADLLIWKSLTAEQVKNNLTELKEKIEALADFEKIETEILAWIKETEKKNGDYLWPLRAALTGLKASPGPFEVALVLGKEKVIARVEKAISLL
jgi:glutamyl/glutaminyl-tRNA synthetase